ncbi:hypothetical protein JEQ04_18860 [Serratia plymuthica]|uniref:hypothetical protein n=1 Tax=Serratia plymuthica TaxID=82996 RepID=UPI0018E473B8|nr:hypothetical protein [Serratia plymuthica]MBI6139909.1 hypothetical protein [Serratia plymuthica]
MNKLVENNKPLSSMSEEELYVALMPSYEELKKSMTKQALDEFEYKDIVSSIYLDLKSKIKFPEEVEGNNIIASLNEEEFNTLSSADAWNAVTSSCATSVYIVIGDCIGLLVSYFGISASIARNATKKLLNQLGPKTLNGLMSSFRNISHAESFVSKVKEIGGLIWALKNALGVSAIISAVKGELGVFEGVKAALLMATQFAIWFASDGVAFFVELGLATKAIYDTVSDVLAANKECSII